MPAANRGLLFLMVFTLIAGIGWIVATRVTDSTQAGLPPAPQVGHPAPDFSLQTVDGETVTLGALQGQPVLLNFWATWCPPCRAEMPHIQQVWQAYQADGLIVLAVDEQESAQTVGQFAAGLGLTFPLLLDVTGEVGNDFQVRALPTSFFIDRQGIVRQKFTGPMTTAILHERLQAILR
ncbi:MAG: TlpA family protein disulfide reductase [Chloroflexota bacterium]